MADPEVNGSEMKHIESKIDETLLKARRILISEGVDSESAKEVIRRLWYLELQDPGKPILLVINSPGGSTDAGFAIYDTIQMISSPVTTLVTGLAASMGSILSLAAKGGKRLASPRARFMIHQPSLSGFMQGQATDLEIQAREILRTRDHIVDVYVDKTKKDRATVEKAIDRDSWMTAREAKDWGLIDDIVETMPQLT